MLYYLLATLYVLVCLLLLLVVLLQQGKGGDMASAFGGGGSQTAFGARAGATVLTRATTVLGVAVHARRHRPRHSRPSGRQFADERRRRPGADDGSGSRARRTGRGACRIVSTGRGPGRLSRLRHRTTPQPEKK